MQLLLERALCVCDIAAIKVFERDSTFDDTHSNEWTQLSREL